MNGFDPRVDRKYGYACPNRREQAESDDWMKVQEIIITAQHWMEQHLPWLTRQRLAVFGATLIIIGVTLGAFESGEEKDEATYSEIVELTLPERIPPASSEPAVGAISPGAAVRPVDQWDTVLVKSGQTLDTIFRQQGFSAALLHRILRLNGDTRNLKKIRPGEAFDFKKDENGGFLQMRYPLDESRFLLVIYENDVLRAETLTRQITADINEAEGVISSSLFLAATEAGLSDAMTMKLANIFGWDIDFVLDIREGDRFFMVYEKLYRDGVFLRFGDILAAAFINQGERFQAIRFESGSVSGYFAPDGRNMRKAFLRAPLNFAYISSGFNPRRMHPVLKRIRPHNGIDYYAPRGTPVYAAGDGSVTRSGYSGANGHHVFLKHDGSIVTKYLHFTNRAVKNGQKVKQGQTIGYVGSTGLATGPHLHYEFVVNGVHRNPRTVSLPKVVPLQGDLLTQFQQNAAPMLTQLSRLESASLYASRE
jgi:murein DD-endopeptidase MepM/ murein hydrolase activator NlpD